MTATPLRVLSLGAGVQSTAVALMAKDGLIEPLDAVVFADTGCEPVAVYRHLRWLAPVLEAAGMPVHVVRTGSLMADALDPAHRFASMPLFVRLPSGKQGMIRRQCTAEYKLKPILAMQRELADIKPRQRPKGVRVECVQGISWDESERMKDPLRPWIRNSYPLVDTHITRWDCQVWMAKEGYPKPARSACKVCPFRTDDEWRWLRDNEPEDWADAVEFDRRIRRGHARASADSTIGECYLHRSMVPLGEVDLTTAEEAGQQVLFAGCDPWGCDNKTPGGIVLVDELLRPVA